MTTPELHPDVTALAPLLGVWEGDGDGHYPTIEPFRYHETATFDHVGKPFLTYGQRTRHADTGEPLHAETGYLRAPAPDRVELVIAQPTGFVEIHEGRFDGGVIDLALMTLGRTSSAKPVHVVRRRIEVDGDVLRYDLWMAHADTPETHHLHAELRSTG